MKKIISILIILFFVVIAGAIELNDIEDQEFIFKGINKDNIFTELVSNKADITGGEAIFIIDNPFNELDLNKTLLFDWYIANGFNYNSYGFEVGSIIEKSNPIYEWNEYNYTCYYVENITLEILNDTCQMSLKNQTGVDKISHLIWTKNTTVGKGTHMIKFKATWDAHLGPQETDWFPEMQFDMDEFSLPDHIKFRKSEWAWFNTSWNYYKEYTNLTGNITYMYFNKSVNDNADFNDTRFISCLNDTLVFNHTLEAKFGTFGQFRVNNIGENCTLRYYGNSIAASSSSASDVYFEPVSAWYLDANTNDSIGVNNLTNNNAIASTGYINGSYDFDGSTSYLDTSEIDLGDDFSVFMWVNLDSIAAGEILTNGRKIGGDYGSIRFRVGSGKLFVSSDLSTQSDCNYETNNIVTGSGVWTLIGFTRTSGGEPVIYVNGTVQAGTAGGDDWSGTIDYDGNKFLIGALDNTGAIGASLDGDADEVYIYDKVITQDEILKLQTQTEPNFIEGNEESGFGPSVVLNSPLNNSAETSQYVIFNTTVTDGILVQSVNLYIDGVLNQTNSSGFNGTYIFNVSVPESNHNWSILAYNNNSVSNQSETRYFISDFFNPVILIDFPIDSTEYNFNITTLNTTASDTHLESCWYSLDNFTTNITFTCNTNVTGIIASEEYNYWRACANDSIGNEACNLSVFRVDTIDPSVIFTSNTTNTTVPANFSEQNWIFVEVNVSTASEKNITFYLTVDGVIFDSITSTVGLRKNNFTDIKETLYDFYVEVCNTDDVCDTTGTRQYGTTSTNGSLNLSLSGIYDNIDAELGSDILVNSTSNISVIYLDIDHPDYGVNYSVDVFENSFNLTIDYFRKNIFNDSTISTILEYVGEQIKYVFFPAHQYDEVDSMSFNISGTNTTQYPENVLINNSNTTDIDRFFPGYLVGDNIYLDKDVDALDNITVSFDDPATKTVSFFMDDGAELISMIFNVTGLEFGFTFTDEYLNLTYTDDILSTTFSGGGFILPGGNTPLIFQYDTYNSVIDTTKWFFGLANGAYSTTGASGDRFDYTISNSETNEYLKLFISNFHEAFTGDNNGIGTAENYVYLNYSLLNIWTTPSIEFDILYEFQGNEDQDSVECTGDYQISLGLANIWNSSSIKHCGDYIGGGDYDDCTEYADTNDEFLHFNLTRQINNSWFIEIGGSERRTGFLYSTVPGPSNPNCGSFLEIYNYTSNRHTMDYSINNADCVDFNVSMNNSWYVSNLEFNTVAQLLLRESVTGNYRNDPGKGCDLINSYVHIYPINQTLYNITNTSYYSLSTQNTANDINEATINTTLYEILPNNYSGSLVPYLSADGGDNYELVTFESQHSFTNIGKDLKYRLNFLFDNGGYLTNIPFVQNSTVFTDIGFPNNISFDFGNDGTIDDTFSGELNSSNSPVTVNVSSADLASALSATPILYNHLISVPLKITTESVGEVRLEFINLTYNPNPISLNATSILNFISNFSNIVDFPISIESIGGNITVDDVRYDYAGGNDTIEILAHNTDYSINLSRNITYYYSRWDYFWGPSGVEWIYFAPTQPTSVNVTPYGQTSTIPILNITNFGYGGKNATLSIYQNGTSNCTNVTMSLNNDKDNGFLLSESFTTLGNLSYLENATIYMWADYNCSYDTWNLYEPNYFFRQCVDGGICSTDIV